MRIQLPLPVDQTTLDSHAHRDCILWDLRNLLRTFSYENICCNLVATWLQLYTIHSQSSFRFKRTIRVGWLLFQINSSLTLYSKGVHHRVHTRVAMVDFWRTFHHGKISPGWWGWGVHAHPLSLYLPSRTKLQCTLQLRGQIYTPLITSLPFM
jgi:hypothetical protein